MDEHVSEKRGFWSALTRGRKAESVAPETPDLSGSSKGSFNSLFGSETAADGRVAATAPEALVSPLTTAPDPGKGRADRIKVEAEMARAPPMRRHVAPAAYLAPTDLEAGSGGSRRVLAIGSCFLESQLKPGRASLPGFEIDFALVNHVADFPAEPPVPIGDYDCQLVAIPLRSVMADAAFLHLAYDDLAGYQAAFERSCAVLKLQLEQRMRWNVAHGTTSFVMNFPVPQFPSMGRFFPRFDLRNIEYFVTMLNQELERLVAGYRSAYILDVDRLAASFGRRYMQDDNFTVFGHGGIIDPGQPIARMDDVGPYGDYYDLTAGRDFAQAILAELRAMLRTLAQEDSVKLVVVDLDDTLWNGVSGDSADIGGHMVEGSPVGLVEALQYVRKRGVLLAIISKNDEARIREIWRSIFHDRLTLEDFSAVRINWLAKPANMADLLGVMNLLPRNVVFIDDNPAERAQMQAAFPAMRILGDNPFHFRRILLLAPEMQPVGVTAESARRTEMVQAQTVREADRAALSVEAFVSQQDVKLRLLRIEGAQNKRFARALELINKTNQFNTTGQRWTEHELAAFMQAGGTMFAYRVEDRYTNYGLVGVVLVQGSVIAQWVMSCRVFGLGVEYAAMGEIVSAVRQAPGGAVRAKFDASTVNQPCHGFLAAAGFVAEGEEWALAPGAEPKRPAHVTLVAAGLDGG